MKIENSVALVTGSNRGLGKALVDALLAAGAARVYAAARGEPQPHASARVVQLRLDVTDPAQIAAVAERAHDVTLLINNAGSLAARDVLTASPAELEADFRTNVFGTLAVTRALVPTLARATHAAIVNVLSLSSLSSVPSMGGYAASKAASHSLTQAIRARLRAERIAVLAALPGPIDTDMVRGLSLPKTPPGVVARGVLEGIEREDEEIFPDPMAQNLAAVWRGDPKALERALSTY